MTRLLLSLVLYVAFTATSHAQAVRRYHQNLTLTEASSIQIDAQGQVEIIKWSGTDILVEITVATQLGSTAILNHLQKEGRYDLVLTSQDGVALMTNKQSKHQSIKVKGADMDEQIRYTISVPDVIPVSLSSDSSVQSGK